MYINTVVNFPNYTNLRIIRNISIEIINKNVGSGRDERRPCGQQLDHKILHVPNQVLYGMVRNSESNHGGRQVMFVENAIWKRLR